MKTHYLNPPANDQSLPPEPKSQHLLPSSPTTTTTLVPALASFKALIAISPITNPNLQYLPTSTTMCYAITRFCIRCHREISHKRYPCALPKLCGDYCVREENMLHDPVETIGFCSCWEKARIERGKRRKEELERRERSWGRRLKRLVGNVKERLKVMRSRR